MRVARQWGVFVLVGFFGPAMFAGKEFPQKPGEDVVPNQILIRLKKGVSAAQIIPPYIKGAAILPLKLPDHYVVNGQLPPGILAALAANGAVEYVEPDRLRRLVGSPNNPGIPIRHPGSGASSRSRRYRHGTSSASRI